MANHITGIKGFNRVGTSINILLASYGNDVVNVATGLGYGLNLNGNNVEMDVFLDRAFIQDFDTVPKTFNGTVWDKTYVGRCMRAKFIKSIRAHARVYLGYCKFSGTAPLDKDGNEITFPTRIFFSDLFIANNLTWGMEWGRNGKVEIGSPFFNLDQPVAQDFVGSNIKVGDPLVITNGNAALTNKTFFVKNIISPLRLEMTENFPATATGQHYWVGSNWQDVGGDDNDSLSGFGENSSQLLVFKLYSMFTYSNNSLRQVPDALGTSSNRSIIEASDGTYYFHGSDPMLSGIYKYDGSGSSRASRAIDPYIRGLSISDYSSVVAWREGDELRFYLGDLESTNYRIDLDKAVATVNTSTNAWDVSPIKDKLTCATTWKFGNENNYYCGNDEGQVLKMGKGNTFNTDPIAYSLETKVYYPEGTEVLNEFRRVQVVGRATKGVRVKYKLWDMPTGVDDEWIALGELNNDKTELVLPNYHQFASGIQLKFEGMDTLENDLYIEKFTIFYTPQQTRL